MWLLLTKLYKVLYRKVSNLLFFDLDIFNLDEYINLHCHIFNIH